MMRTLKRFVKLLINASNRRAYEAQRFSVVNERPIEYAFALKCLSTVAAQRVLDVGSGTSPWPALMAKCGFVVTAIDEMKEYWGASIFNKHFYVIQDDITNPNIKDEFDFITCISTLEHIPNHSSAIKSMLSFLKPNGHIVLTFPYNDQHYVSNVYELSLSCVYNRDIPYICQVFSSKEIEGWLEENRVTIVGQEFYQLFSGEFWSFGDRIYPPRKVERTDPHHLACMLMRKGSKSVVS